MEAQIWIMEAEKWNLLFEWRRIQRQVGKLPQMEPIDGRNCGALFYLSEGKSLGSQIKEATSIIVERAQMRGIAPHR